jgi:hypothetical protein
MKIMFIASIRGKEKHADAFNEIINTLKKQKYQVFHEHVTDYDQKKLDTLSKQDDMEFHSTILNHIKGADIVVAECSYQSLSVGYLISYAIELSKPTIIFYNSAFPKPNLFPTLSQSEKLLLAEYHNITELPELVKEYVEYAKMKTDVRFNFFISPHISNYLDWITKNYKIPRSVYLRQLIETDMDKHQDFSRKGGFKAGEKPEE